MSYDSRLRVRSRSESSLPKSKLLPVPISIMDRRLVRNAAPKHDGDGLPVV